MSDANPAITLTDEAGNGPRVAVKMRGIIKRYASVIACDQVDFEVRRGEIQGLLGQNGAGKSTLMKVLTGVITPDAGSIEIDGQQVVISSPQEAGALGIAMVHQHFSVIDALTVWENVTLGERTKLDKSGAVKAVKEISARYGLDIDPFATIGSLTAGQRQRVEIIKCLRRDPSILIFDEPTSVLTLAESEELFTTLRHVVTAENRAVVLISHKLDEILNATDYVTIMRNGVVVAEAKTSETDARGLAREMVGRDVSLRGEAVALGLMHAAEQTAVTDATFDAEELQARPIVLDINNATVTGRGGVKLLDDFSLEVHRGEIVGLAGVEGNGQATLEKLLMSLVPLSEGDVQVDGEKVKDGRPGSMGHAGVAVIPEDRHEAGCVLDMTVAENLVLDDLDRVSKGRLVSKQLIRENAQKLIKEYEIKTPSPDTPMRSLSGGNQQKVVLARELSRNPKVLVAAQPTHGLDVGAVEYMTNQLRAAAEAGVAVLLISTELEEILALSDRIAVINEGKLMGVVERNEADLETLGMMMGGQAL